MKLLADNMAIAKESRPGASTFDPRAADANPIKAALQSCAPSFWVVFATSFVMNILQLAPSLFMMQVYDRVLTSRSVATLVLMCAAVIFLLIVMSALDDLRNRMLVRIGVRIDLSLHREVFKAIFRRGLRFPGVGQARALQDVGAIRNFASGPALIALFDLPWTPVFIIICWLVHPWLAAAAVVSAIALVGLTLLSELTTKKLLENAAFASTEADGFAEASVRNAEAVEAMGMLPGLMKRWLRGYYTTIIRQAVASDRAAVINSTSRWIQGVSQSLVLALGAYLVITQQITSGLMIICTMVVARGLLPINQLVASWKSLVAARAAARRLSVLLAEYSKGEADRIALPRFTGSVSLDRVVVATRDGRAILKSVSVAFPAGAAVGVIGPSGSGKTTLARAILGLATISQGKVRFDGADIALLDKSEIGPDLGYLPQDIELFNGTVAENVARFGELDSERIVSACQITGVHDLVLSLPQGYETVIGDRGVTLSAGQRQRIGLARAIYGDPRLVVLDEPNSNLDVAGEQALHQTIAHLKANGVTIIVIAHRSSILSALDRLLVMNSGAIEKYGTMQEVMGRPVRPVQGVAS